MPDKVTETRQDDGRVVAGMVFEHSSKCPGGRPPETLEQERELGKPARFR